MIHEKIQLALQEVRKLQDKLKDVKKDIKAEEKIEDEHYLELKASLKEMKAQVKDFEDEALSDLQSSDFYNKLREERLKAEEDFALAKEKLFTLLATVPMKPFDLDIKDEDGVVRVQAMPEMKLFVNGKEIKKAA